MKKLFAIFCAVILAPNATVHAWVGGPFSNNSFFGASGDDGVYEAVGTTTNGLGLFRIVVGNEFPGVNPAGVQASVPSQAPNTGTTNTTALTVPGINSGNFVFGALGNSNNNIWFFQGVSYFGTTIGTVNSVQGIAAAVANATDAANNSVGSSFLATLVTSGNFLPATAFSGTGELRVSTDPNTAVSFTVFGSKVSNQITFGL
ncbi:MAG: hypothetical protein AAF491_04965 [Verrucomicrobiota bacterium]